MTPRRLVLLAAALAAVLCLPLAAGAVVPPKSCGMMTVKGKRYQVKADQMSCRTGREHTRRYLRSGAKPRGYRCRNLSREKGRVTFTCNKEKRVFFAIRR